MAPRPLLPSFRPRRALAAAALLALAALAGCAARGPGHPLPGGASATPAATGAWGIDLEASLGYNAAFGQPFQQVTSAGGDCARFVVPMPANATRLDIQLSGSPVQGGGAGYLTFQLLAPDGRVVQPMPGPRATHVNATVASPAAGSWVVWVWPDGAAAHQFWGLRVHLEGVGPKPLLRGRAQDGAGQSC